VRKIDFLSMLALVTLAVAPSFADLKDVSRSISKEPAYKSKPKYCLLVFGPTAKSRFWLVLDGDILHVDRNGSGDLTENGKQLALPAFEKSDDEMILEHRQAAAGDLRDGADTHAELVIDQFRFRLNFAPKDKEGQDIARFVRSTKDGMAYAVTVSTRQVSGGTCKQVAFIDGGGCLHFADSPQEAPVIHFGGAYEMCLSPIQKLARGEKPSDLEASIGTPGLGNGTFATLLYEAHSARIPDNIHPVAEIVFLGKAPSSRLRSTKVLLDRRC
jgi:hypothetical protein